MDTLNRFIDYSKATRGMVTGEDTAIVAGTTGNLPTTSTGSGNTFAAGFVEASTKPSYLRLGAFVDVRGLVPDNHQSLRFQALRNGAPITSDDSIVTVPFGSGIDGQVVGKLAWDNNHYLNIQIRNEPDTNRWGVEFAFDTDIVSNATVVCKVLTSQGRPGADGQDGAAGTNAAEDKLVPSSTPLPATDDEYTVRTYDGQLWVRVGNAWVRKVFVPHGGTEGQVLLYNATGDAVIANAPWTTPAAVDTRIRQLVKPPAIHGASTKFTTADYDLPTRLKEFSDGLTGGGYASNQSMMRIGRPRPAAPNLTTMVNNIDWGQTSIADVTPRQVDGSGRTYIPVRILKTEKRFLSRYQVVAGDAGDEVYIAGGDWTFVGDDDADNDWSYYIAIVPNPGLPAEGDRAGGKEAVAPQRLHGERGPRQRQHLQRDGQRSLGRLPVLCAGDPVEAAGQPPLPAVRRGPRHVRQEKLPRTPSRPATTPTLCTSPESRG